MGWTAEDTRAEKASSKLRSRILENRVKMGAVSKDSVQAYVKAAKDVASQKHVLTAPVQNQIKETSEFMEKFGTFFEENGSLFENALAHGKEYPESEVSAEWKAASKELQNALKASSLGFPFAPRVSFYRKKIHIALGSFRDSIPHFPHFWSADYSQEEGCVTEATINPHCLDCSVYDAEEYTYSEKTGKRKRRANGHGEFHLMFQMVLVHTFGRGHAPQAHITPLNFQCFKYVTQRTAKSFSTDLLTLASLVNTTVSEGYVADVKVPVGNDDLFTEREIEAVKIICAEKAIVDVVQK
jgi:hypothetical protein